VQPDELAVDEQVAVVGAHGAADDLAQRGLARAVLADEGVDLPRLDRHADVVERAGGAVALADAAGLDAHARDRGHMGAQTGSSSLSRAGRRTVAMHETRILTRREHDVVP
jgi:hypothetical protein